MNQITEKEGITDARKLGMKIKSVHGKDKYNQ